MQNIFQLPGDGKATTPRPPPRSCTNQFEQSRLQFILDAWKPKLHQSLGHFDLSRPNKPQILDQKQKTGGNWREKRKAMIIWFVTFTAVLKKKLPLLPWILVHVFTDFCTCESFLASFLRLDRIARCGHATHGICLSSVFQALWWSPSLPAFKK